LAGAALGAYAQTHVEGAEYYKADQFTNAKELLQKSLSNQGTDKSVSDYYLGLIAIEEGKTSEASQYFNKGVSENPDYAYNYVGQGLVQLLNNDLKGAESLFKEAQKHSKKDAALEIAIARAYDKADPVAYEKQITKQVEKARKQNMEAAEIYIFEGDQAKEKKEYGSAAAKYEMAANYNSNATEAYVKYANLFTQVNPQYAIDMLKKLLSVNPQSALGQRELANAYYNKGDYANAAKQYGSYVQNPSHFKSDENRYAFLLFYGQDYQKGYDYATKLLSEDSSNFTAMRYQFMNAAQIKSMESELLPMAEALYNAHKANPKANKLAPIDYTLIADELTRAQKVDEAVEVIQGAIKEDPENANYNKQLANIYVEQNNISKAADAYQEYMKKTKEPGYNDNVQQALYAYFAGRQNLISNHAESVRYFEMGRTYANNAKEMAPQQYKPVKILGDIAVASAAEKDMQTAGHEYYEEAVVLLEGSQDPSKYKSDAKEMYNYLGNYYLDMKNVSKAKEYFNKYLTLDPNNADYRKFVEGLK
jgi:tetratricopeptide (TPR) repeat protein